jgi:hypothetical protein
MDKDALFDDIHAALGYLHEDIVTAGSHLAAAEPALQPFWSRTLFRAAFAFTEAEIWHYKQAALALAEKSQVQFTETELARLRDQEHEIKGERRFLSFTANCRFAVGMLAKAMQSRFVLNVGGKEWCWFNETIEIRNRITHPKTMTDTLIPYDEVMKLLDVVSWLDNLSQQILDAVPEEDEQHKPT